MLFSLQPVLLLLLLLVGYVWGTQAVANLGYADSCNSFCSDSDMGRRQATLEKLLQGDYSHPPFFKLCHITDLPSLTSHYDNSTTSQ
jgi:hypothetical protein